VRKVLGAGTASVVGLLTADFVKLVGIAFVVAAPLAWLATHSWLAAFPYRAAIGIGPFLVAGVIAMAIALATVTFQAVRAARVKPVTVLNYE
jgi:putative ABC transport system permease protein